MKSDRNSLHLWLTLGRHSPHTQIAHFRGDAVPHLIHCSLDPTRSHLERHLGPLILFLSSRKLGHFFWGGERFRPIVKHWYCLMHNMQRHACRSVINDLLSHTWVSAPLAGNHEIIPHKVPPNPNFGDVNRHSQGKLVKILQLSHYGNYCTDLIKILQNDKNWQTLLAGGPNKRTMNPRWRTAA